MESPEVPELLPGAKMTSEGTKNNGSETLHSLVPCPYNREHLVSPCEFNKHLLSCRTKAMSDHPHALKFVRCAYNIRHILPLKELEFHESFCKKGKYSKMAAEIAKEPILLNVPDGLTRNSDFVEDNDDRREKKMNKRRDRQENLVEKRVEYGEGDEGEEFWGEDDGDEEEEEIETTSSEISDSEEDENEKDVEDSEDYLTRREVMDLLEKS